ncbi:uncharacterized protein TRIADDRAFT_26766 [Trichoplax adhaerens]|uniref:K Homology domain-containing protein n=1 Tax=Trichoplax adhaerens TaxID=10228 RepID=B3S083_TRIAD|nr:hypothetical protein TRIADDRAFT_26766 [Trichoplax adhaerens]EDV24343.1 hypothetical protein TRIADDRAFT_26766 [Trichoplax adhaerens]|eukprot:XP_002113869.1 hypothetical protein TRIADDRAFT_26766 [Trichoplax adhaerens]
MDTISDVVDDQKPDYPQAFPPLPTSSRPQETTTNMKWGPSALPSIPSSSITQVFHVPMEERKFGRHGEQVLGPEQQQAQVCKEVMQKTNTTIEVSSTKDQTLTIMVTGKKDAVAKAKRLILIGLQKQSAIELPVQKEYLGAILGRGGKSLQQLELTTSTKIKVIGEGPIVNIRITGSRDKIDDARHQILVLVDQQEKLAHERLNISKIYHPFISGPNGSIIKTISEKTGARIHVPPISVEKDEIVVSGEKDGVLKAVKEISAIYNEKRRKCKTVSVEVKKSQHKYVIGHRGQGLQEILELTGVSVEVPPSDSNSETITLRGEQEHLGNALTHVYEKANSTISEKVDAPVWLHRHLIGKKGENISKVLQDMSKLHVEFERDRDLIILEGKPEEVQVVKKNLQKFMKNLVDKMDHIEIKINRRFYKQLIGKNKANINAIKNQTGTMIYFPSDESSEVISIEGDSDGVKLAKEKILSLVKKWENERVKDLVFEQKFHRRIIGSKGSNIREISAAYPEISINFPDPQSDSDVVQVRGPKDDVDKVCSKLKKIYSNLIESNHVEEFSVFKQFHRNIIGKGGITIRKIREETNTRIDIPNENSGSDIIKVTGRQKDVKMAREKILAIQKELANVEEITVSIPQKYHNRLIGSKGKLIRSISNDCGGVIIKIPDGKTTSDKIVIRGPKDDIKNAKAMLLEIANEQELHSFTTEVRAKPEFHRFLIGAGGRKINKLKQNTSTRIIFPTQKDEDKELIVIIGTKENIEKTKAELEDQIRELENTKEETISIAPKYYKRLLANGRQILREISEENGNVIISIPRDNASDKVIIKGSSSCVDSAKVKLLEIVDEIDSMVTIDCQVSQKYHKNILGVKGCNIQQVVSDFKVDVKFPNKSANRQKNLPNGGAVDDNDPIKTDIITITGLPANVEGAKEAILSFVPISEEMNVSIEYHRSLIGVKGRDIRAMMEKYSVNISVPPADQHSDCIKIFGTPSQIEKAKSAILDRIKELEEEKEDKKKRNFQIVVEVDPCHHSKIIGPKGSTISKIRADHNVQVKVPSDKESNDRKIVITGYENEANAAKLKIEKIVQDLENQIVESYTMEYRIQRNISRLPDIREITKDRKVSIKFSKDQENNNVEITGLAENIEGAKKDLDKLIETEREKIEEKELLSHYMYKREERQDHQSSSRGRNSKSRGYVVRNAPWDHSQGLSPPSTTDTQAFPAFGDSIDSNGPNSNWGPSQNTALSGRNIQDY